MTDKLAKRIDQALSEALQDWEEEFELQPMKCANCDEDAEMSVSRVTGKPDSIYCPHCGYDDRLG